MRKQSNANEKNHWSHLRENLKEKKKPFLYSVALPGLMNFLRELSSMEALKRSIKSELLES